MTDYCVTAVIEHLGKLLAADPIVSKWLTVFTWKNCFFLYHEFKEGGGWQLHLQRG
ncbi:MAG: hypothetical protein H6667_26000 [Ardenticatenaceae bacterium]|nr:hypothetical protein [Ardenticatenaceae bacterium]